MAANLNRRAALSWGLGTVAAASTVWGTSLTATAQEAGVARQTRGVVSAASASNAVAEVYQTESVRAGGVWNSLVTVVDAAGTAVPAVEEAADEVVEAYSVNKIAVAVAVLDKVDRGLISLDQQLEVSADIVVDDVDGIFHLDGAYPSLVTVGHALAVLLTVSDNTSVRLCGLVCPAAELNEILVAKGFPQTQVVPVENPNRFFLGTTTPRETHDLVNALVAGSVLSPESTEFLLNTLRAPVAFTDGIRREMSSAERLRVATKAGWFADGRNEAGVIFDVDGAPVLTYSLFARGSEGADDFGATHPVVQARSVMGRVFLDSVTPLSSPKPKLDIPRYQPRNGG
ncbi:serine hydrolase [Actinoalloteichus hymeniacidonis]|uniref:Beta-lactamase class A n=1 Tax=Actinoalloteichus hymeniacidonis TaxID=340345 RepID=A0AAC9HSC7_9PSEU|nr:serine hydrolase [Actinoalloteichus hymeniacidonis]AOS63575.1 beta-lactamase class A [Actinoalloteichus hymeniacidonis]MBB5908379.1 beta-lactamase class A [Actinoalloteichus hymeniacidonis]